MLREADDLQMLVLDLKKGKQLTWEESSLSWWLVFTAALTQAVKEVPRRSRN